MTTPDQRRKNEIDATEYCLRLIEQQADIAPRQKATLLVEAMAELRRTHEDPNERALGQALRYGLEPNLRHPIRRSEVIAWHINTPQGPNS